MPDVILPPFNRRNHDRFRALLDRVSERCEVKPALILGTSRQAKHVLARQLLQYLLVKDHKLAPIEVSTRFSCARSAVHYNLARIQGFLDVGDAVITAHLQALRS